MWYRFVCVWYKMTEFINGLGMYVFAARYLLPCTHVMLSQRRAIREADLYGKSADKFLSLIPECCRLNAGSSADEDGAFWGKGELQTPVWGKKAIYTFSCGCDTTVDL